MGIDQDDVRSKQVAEFIFGMFNSSHCKKKKHKYKGKRILEKIKKRKAKIKLGRHAWVRWWREGFTWVMRATIFRQKPYKL